MDIKEIGNNTRNFIETAQDRDYFRALANMVLNLWVPYTTGLVNRTIKINTKITELKHYI